MWKLRPKLVSLTCLWVLLFLMVVKVQAQPLQSGLTIYQQAKEELTSDMYALYRLVDRIARANGFDNRPWRVKIIPKYDINAYANQVNLIAVYDGILDQIGGDSSALACVVAHEMGHHIKRHQAVGAAQKAKLSEQIDRETERAIFDIEQAAKKNGIDNRQKLQRVTEVVTQKKRELEKSLESQQRLREFEADEIGYIASVTAGFDPEGCLTVMEVLGRSPVSEFDSSYPAVPKRIEAIKALMIKYPWRTLVLQGEEKIVTTKPLTYEYSKDNQSLRINSSHGGSIADDIERRFGNR